MMKQGVGKLRTRELNESRERRGAAAIEMALVLPLLCMLLLGACDFGRFAYTQLTVSNAARVGAGQASRNRPTAATRVQWEAAIRQAVRNELEGLSKFDAKQMSVTITSVEESGGTHRASVQVKYPFETLVKWGVIPHRIAFQETAVFRIVRE